MTIEEKENLYKKDKEKRIELISKAIMIGISNKYAIEQCSDAWNTQKYFQEHYNSYLGNMLTQEQYKASDFWFNDAGFQFKWRNFENNIQLECLSWKEVYNLIKQFSSKSTFNRNDYRKAKYIIQHNNYEDVLTIGNEYDIHGEKEEWLYIQDDRGSYQYYRKDCFEIIA